MIANIILEGTPDTIIEEIQAPILHLFLFKLEDTRSSSFLLLILRAIRCVLQVDMEKLDGKYVMARRLEEVGALTMLEQLHQNKEKKVSTLANAILGMYFEIQEKM